MSFLGTYTHALDSKKRVFIPAKYRDELGDQFYITRKFDNSLSIYTEEEWAIYLEKIEKLPESLASDVQQFILGGAHKCTPDSNGRIIIEDPLLKYAGITKNITFVGAGKQIKVWAEEVYREHEKSLDLKKLNDILKEYGL